MSLGMSALHRAETIYGNGLRLEPASGSSRSLDWLRSRLRLS